MTENRVNQRQSAPPLRLGREMPGKGQHGEFLQLLRQSYTEKPAEALREKETPISRKASERNDARELSQAAGAKEKESRLRIAKRKAGEEEDNGSAYGEERGDGNVNASPEPVLNALASETSAAIGRGNMEAKIEFELSAGASYVERSAPSDGEPLFSIGEITEEEAIFSKEGLSSSAGNMTDSLLWKEVSEAGNPMAASPLPQKAIGAGKPLESPEMQEATEGREAETGEAEGRTVLSGSSAKNSEEGILVERGRTARPLSDGGARREERESPENESSERAASSGGYGMGAIAENPLRLRIRQEEVPETISLSSREGELSEDLSALLISRIQSLSRSPLLITLEPKNLGQILMRVSFVGAQARISLFSENPETLEMLSRNAQEMANIVQEKTGTVTAVLIPDRQELSGEGGQQAENHENHDRAMEELEKRYAKQERARESGDFLQQLRLGLL